MLVHVQKARQPVAFQIEETDYTLADGIIVAVDKAAKASAVQSNNTIALVHRHFATFEAILPSDREAVVGGLAAWRRGVWSETFGDLADSLAIPKDKRKAIAPYVSDLGSCLWYGIELTKGERLATISELREALAEHREPKGGDALIVSAINSLAPVKNGAVRPRFTQEDVALACASLTDEQREVIGELAVLLCGHKLDNPDDRIGKDGEHE